MSGGAEPSVLGALRSELESLRTAREELERDLAELRADGRTLAVADHVRARVAAGRRRRNAAAVAAALGLVAAAGMAITYVRHVEPERLPGTVRAVRGPLPIQAGASCVVTSDWLVGRTNAALRVDCGGMRLYGSRSSGAAQCTLDDAHHVLSCADGGRVAADGDPRIELERAERRVVVDDAQWGVEIALDVSGAREP